MEKLMLNTELSQASRSLFFTNLRSNLSLGRYPAVLDKFDSDKAKAFTPYTLTESQLLFDAVATFAGVTQVALEAIWDVLNYEIDHSDIDGYWTRVGDNTRANRHLNEFREATLDSDNCWTNRINDSSLSPSISAIRIFKDPGTFHKDFFTKTSEVLQDSKYSDYEKSVVATLVEFFKTSRIEAYSKATDVLLLIHSDDAQLVFWFGPLKGGIGFSEYAADGVYTTDSTITVDLENAFQLTNYKVVSGDHARGELIFAGHVYSFEQLSVLNSQFASPSLFTEESPTTEGCLNLSLPKGFLQVELWLDHAEKVLTLKINESPYFASKLSLSTRIAKALESKLKDSSYRVMPELPENGMFTVEYSSNLDVYDEDNVKTDLVSVISKLTDTEVRAFVSSNSLMLSLMNEADLEWGLTHLVSLVIMPMSSFDRVFQTALTEPLFKVHELKLSGAVSPDLKILVSGIVDEITEIPSMLASSLTVKKAELTLKTAYFELEQDSVLLIGYSERAL